MSRVALITIDNPPVNATSHAVRVNLMRAIQAVNEDDQVSAAVLAGAGKTFVAGADIREFGAPLADPQMPAVIAAIFDSPKPFVAALHGHALGGGFELALACDFIFATGDATFALPEIALGVFPPAASALLPWRVGGARATRAIVTGETRGAREWEAAGLLEVAAADAGLQHHVETWFARTLAPRSAEALRNATVAARAGLLADVRIDLPWLERFYLDKASRTADAGEGIAAFLERRSPRWVDR